MIFEGRLLDKITYDEIEALVATHFGERQHLEFKEIINHKDDDDRLEILRDIASLANGGGGYLIIGIKDDGKGNAQIFKSLPLDKIESIKTCIRDLCLNHISERIDGMEFESREIKGNNIIIIRIPESVRTPHMVTFGNRTDFYKRYSNGKLAMTLSEIKEKFNGDVINRKLNKIEEALGYIISKGFQITKDKEQLKVDQIKKEKDQSEVKETKVVKTIQCFSPINDGQLLEDQLFGLFQGEVIDNPFMRISITPEHLEKHKVEIEKKEITQLIQNPPESRHAGWNMRIPYYSIERNINGIQIGEKSNKILKLFENGHMEFWTPLNESFCWRQSADEFKKNPQLYPYPMVEYPVTFLRLYKRICEVSQIDDQHILSINYLNLKGYRLFPFAPGIMGYEFPVRKIVSYPDNHLLINNFNVSSDFNPENTAFNIISKVYNTFGLENDTVPFYDIGQNKFIFPS